MNSLIARLPSWQSVAIGFAVILFCLFFSVTIPFHLWLFSTPVVLLVAVVILGIALRVDKTYALHKEGLLWSCLVLTYGTAAMDLVLPFNASGLMEAWFIVIAVPLLLLHAPKYVAGNTVLKVVLGLIAGCLFLGLVYALVYRVHHKAVAYQFLYNLKLPLMILAGLGVGWSLKTEKWIVRCTVAYIVYAAAWMALEFGAYGAYKSVARGLGEVSYTSNPFLFKMAPRLAGPFIHSGLLAMYSAFLGGFLLIFVLSKRLIGIWPRFLIFVLFIFMVLAGQQQEMACALAGALLLLSIYKTKFRMSSVMIASVSVLIGSLVMLFFLQEAGQIDKLSQEWGFGSSYTDVTSARPVLYRGGFTIGAQYFPMGTGLGSYAGIGAKLFDREMYERLGFSQYWWYRADQFLLDTYWPNFIAESGWIGAALMILMVCILMAYTFYKAWVCEAPMTKRVWSAAFFCQFMIVGNSLTSPSYSDPNVSLLAFVLLGIAITLERRQKAGEFIDV